MYENAIREIPADQWKTGDIDYLTPSRIVCHAIMSGDVYTGESTEFDWSHRFGKSPFNLRQDELPSKEQVLKFHTEMKNKISEWLMSQDDKALLSKETVFTWTGSSRMSWMLYLMAHYRQHFGELNAELRHRGLDRIKWKTH